MSAVKEEEDPMAMATNAPDAQTTPVTEPAAGAPEALDDPPAPTPSMLRGTLQQASNSAASFLGSARVKTTEFIQGFQPKQAPKAGGADSLGPASPPAEEAHADQHRAAGSAAVVANTLMEAAAGLSRKTRENSSAAYQAAVQGLRRLTAPTRKVAAVCKADLRIKPCPQVLLLCCNWVATKGLSCTHLFQEGQPQAQVEALATALEGHLVLLPPDLDPALASAVITHFLGSLEEPLLTYRLSGRWVAAGKALSVGDIGAVGGVLEDLPLVNWSTLRLLMETCYRIASQFNVTGMNALALATALAPVLLWHEQPTPPPGAQPRTSQTQHLADMATASFLALKSKLVPSQASGDAAAAATTTTDPSSPAAGAIPEAPIPDGGVVLPASEGPAATVPEKAHVVLDEDEELLVGDAGLFLEHSLAQQQPGAGPTSAGSGGGVARVSGGGTGAKAVLEGEELGGAIAAIEYLILNFDELFVFV